MWRDFGKFSQILRFWNRKLWKGWNSWGEINFLSWYLKNCNNNPKETWYSTRRGLILEILVLNCLHKRCLYEMNAQISNVAKVLQFLQTFFSKFANFSCLLSSLCSSKFDVDIEKIHSFDDWRHFLWIIEYQYVQYYPDSSRQPRLILYFSKNWPDRQNSSRLWLWFWIFSPHLP